MLAAEGNSIPSPSPIPSTFTQQPYNPYKARIEERERREAVEATNQETKTAVVNAPVEQTTVTSSVTVPPVYTPAATMPQSDAMYAELLKQAETERQKLLEESAAKDAAIQNLLKEQQELEEIRRQQRIQESLSNEAFAELSSIDPEDAKRLSATVLNAAQASLAPIQKEIQEQKRVLDERLTMQQQQVADINNARILSEINAAHPDLAQIIRTPEYSQFMAQKDGYSVKTRGDRAMEEFRAGNAAYLINLLGEFKSNSGSLPQVATVAPVQMASNNAIPPEPSKPEMTLAELNAQFRMGMDRDEYSKRLRELRAANKT